MNRSELFLGAVESGDPAKVEAMLVDDPILAETVGENGTSALLLALYTGNTEIARTIAAHRTAMTVFEAAALGQNDRLAHLLNAEPQNAVAYSYDGFTALHLASFFGHTSTAEMLLRRGSEPNAVSHNGMNVTPLHSAIAGRDEKSVLSISQLLIDSHAAIDAMQQGGFTPLMGAVQNGYGLVVELLLHRGADKAATNDAGETAHDLAVAGGHSDVALLLA